jgi:hypothetical protein
MASTTRAVSRVAPREQLIPLALAFTLGSLMTMLAVSGRRRP